MIKPPPEWFNINATDPSPWASIRVSVAAIDWFDRLWATPSTGPAMRNLWGSFLATEAHFRAQLPRVDWTTRVTDRELIKFLHVAMGVDQGITECVPDHPDLPRGAKARLYYHGLLMVELGHAYEIGVAPATAVEFAVMKALSGAACYAMANFTRAELRRRLGIATRDTPHVGVYAAALELLRQAEHLTPVFLDGVDADDVVDGLRRATWKETRGRLLAKGLSPDLVEDFLQSLEGQAAIAIEHAWGRTDPLELLARALDGELNIAPRKIVDSAVKAAQPLINRDELEIVFESRAKPSWRSPPPDAPDLAAEAQGLLDRLAADPNIWPYLLADERTTRPETRRRQKDLARRLGVDPKTVRALRKRIEDHRRR